MIYKNNSDICPKCGGKIVKTKAKKYAKQCITYY